MNYTLPTESLWILFIQNYHYCFYLNNYFHCFYKLCLCHWNGVVCVFSPALFRGGRETHQQLIQKGLPPVSIERISLPWTDGMVKLWYMRHVDSQSLKYLHYHFSSWDKCDWNTFIGDTFCIWFLLDLIIIYLKTE